MSAGIPTTAVRLEAWLAGHCRQVVVLLAIAAAFVRVNFVLQVAGGPLPRLHEIIQQSDNHHFDQWARHLAAGDWLQRVPQHPVNGWMRKVALEAIRQDPHLPVRLGLASGDGYDPEAMAVALWDRWMGGAAYYQEPGYPYLVALTYRFTGAEAWHVYVWQLLLGIATVLLVWAAARLLLSETAALFAGTLAVLAPAPLMLEVTLLRDGPVCFATAAVLLAMVWAPGNGRGRWLVLGLVLGAATVLRQSFLFCGPVFGLLRLATVRSPWRERLPAAGLVALGVASAMLPGIVRNLVVGVGPLTFSTTSMLASAHTSDALPLELGVSPVYSRIMVETDGRLLPSLLAAISTHASPWGFVLLNLQKALYAWHAYEVPNNVDFYVFRMGAPMLAWLPATTVVLTPLAVMGAISKRWSAAPVYIVALANFSTVVLLAPLARYRAPILVALMPLAGAGAAALLDWIANRRWVPLVAAASCTAAYCVWALGSPPGLGPGKRAAGYSRDGRSALSDEEPALAALFFGEAHRLTPGDLEVRLRLGQSLAASQAVPDALPHLAAAAKGLGTPEAHEAYALGLAAADRRAEAVAEAHVALAADPNRAAARRLLETLEPAPAP